MYINALNITNYRSLRNVAISGLGPVTILYGPNNSGKSNILAAIEAILRGKTDVASVADVAGGKRGNPPAPEKRSPFHQGRLGGFTDCFYLNRYSDPIAFELGIAFTNDELKEWKKIIEGLRPDGAATGAGGISLSDNTEKHLRIHGQFTHFDKHSCETATTLVTLNGNLVVYKSGKSPGYCPSLEQSKDPEHSIDQRLGFFNKLMRRLTDSFLLIGADRFLGSERISSVGQHLGELNAKNFKQFMFLLATTKSRHDDFKKIKDKFNTAPFSYGDISFDIDQATQQLEIVVERKKVSLPLERMGQGVQQVLFLIGSVLSGRRPIVAIEEVELNLSHKAQEMVFEMLKSLVKTDPRLADQIIVTSHSPFFHTKRDGVKHFEVSYDDAKMESNVKPSTPEMAKLYFGPLFDH